jgi:hypothetical protein
MIMSAAGAAQIILGLVQLGKLANETIALYQNGVITDEELAQRWERLKLDLQTANARWESAGGRNNDR